MPILWSLLFFAAGAARASWPIVESGPGECVIVARVDAAASDVTGAPECDRKTAPASTFKIPHALIALQIGAVETRTVVKWDGSEQPFETWKRDHTLDSAIRWSVYPFFRHTAAVIGRDRMREWLTQLQYGSDTFDRELTAFWTNGDLEISPGEQVAFLQRLFAGKLPIAPRHVAAVKASFTMAAGRITNASGVHAFGLRWPPGTVVRAKTGNARVHGERISWLIGQLEVAGTEYVFASRVRSSTRSLGPTSAADLAVRTLNRIAPR